MAQESQNISTMQNTLWMLLGAALVSIGVLASALADRIRGLSVSRDHAPRERTSRTPAAVARPVIPVVEFEAPVRAVPPKPPRTPRHEPKAAGSTDGGDDVIAALVAAG